jgi:hypothetical protein
MLLALVLSLLLRSAHAVIDTLSFGARASSCTKRTLCHASLAHAWAFSAFNVRHGRYTLYSRARFFS